MTEGSAIAEGKVPFVLLPDNRVVLACFRVTPRVPPSFGETESINWTHEFDGRTFAVVGKENPKDNWVPMDDRWASGGMKAMRASGDGVRFTVSYDYYWMHHYGSLSGLVTLEFDLTTMQISVDMDLQFESG